MNAYRNRAAITGTGIVSPIGIGMKAFEAALYEGAQNLSELVDMPTPRGKNRAAIISDTAFEGSNRGYLMAKKAITEAIDNSKFTIGEGEAVGLILATINGDSRTLENMYSDFINAHESTSELDQAIHLYPNGSLLNALGDQFGLYGPRLVVSNACASGNIALGLALDMIREASCKKVIVVGLEIIKPSMVWGAERAGFIGNQLRPFDKDRNGSILGEGAGALIIESEDILDQQKPLGWLDGFGCACDKGASAITLLEDGSGLYRSMKLAIEDGHRTIDELEYINAHAPGTPLIDRVECSAVAKLCADSPNEVFVNSTKSMTAHLAGASAIVEVIAILVQMQHAYLHANVNLKTPDPILALNPIGNERVLQKVELGISNACGGGGLNTSVLIGVADEKPHRNILNITPARQELVISGIGNVSTLGTDIAAFQQATPSKHNEHYLNWFDIYQWYDKSSKYGYFNRAAQLGAAAGAMSWEHAFANRVQKDYEDNRIAIIAGTYLGGSPEASEVLCERLQSNPNSILPSMSLDHGLHLGAALVSREFGLRGLTYTLTGTLTAGLQAVIIACKVIQNNRADAALALAYDALEQPVQHAVMLLNGGMKNNNIGEGAAAVFIERKEIGQARKGSDVTVIKDAVSLSGSFKSPSGIRKLAERIAAQIQDTKWQVLYLAAFTDPRVDLLARHLIHTVGNQAKIKRLQPTLNYCMAADSVLAAVAAISREEHALILSADLSGTVAALILEN